MSISKYHMNATVDISVHFKSFVKDYSFANVQTYKKCRTH